MKRVAKEYLSRYRLLQEQGNIFIEVVHVKAPLIEQFTYNLNATLKKKDRIYSEAIKQGNKDFEYGTLPSLLKLKALQEKESQMAHENRMKKVNQSIEGGGQGLRSSIKGDGDMIMMTENDVEESEESARQINEIITARSKDASLVITNLPPILPG